MKQVCPSCHGAGISGLAKRWSARECPAKCGLCGGLSHVLASSSSGIFVGGCLVFVVVLIAGLGFNLQPWLAALIASCLWVVFNTWAWGRAEMFPIPKENARVAASVGWGVAGVSALFGLLG